MFAEETSLATVCLVKGAKTYMLKRNALILNVMYSNAARDIQEHATSLENMEDASL